MNQTLINVNTVITEATNFEAKTIMQTITITKQGMRITGGIFF
jgi:hypothetical protein